MPTYAILFQGNPFVTPQRFDYAVTASVFGYWSGQEYEVMHWTEDGWRNAWGESAVEVIRKRWACQHDVI